MSETKHTPEPWTYNYDAGVMLSLSVDEETIVFEAAGPVDQEMHAALNRAAACVNAMAGLDPEGIPGLVEAVKHVSGYYVPEAYPGITPPQPIRALRAALAKVRGDPHQEATIPRDWPVQPAETGDDLATCGVCGLSWDDAEITEMTPAPSGRCPFEAFHG